MSRYSHPLQTPGEPTFEGDKQFVGLDMETNPWQLPPGYYAKGQNARCASGALTKRPGTIKPLFANVLGFAGGILGSAIFQNPNSDTKLMLIATPAAVWKISSGGYPTSIALPDGVRLSAPIEFAQHFGKVLLHRGASDGVTTTLEWDGDPAAPFKVIEKAHPDVTLTSLVPNTDWSVEFSGRSLFPVSRDEFGVSDEQDYTSWDAVEHKFRANPGTSDSLTGLFPYLTGNLIIGKRQGIDVFKNFTGNLTGLSAELVSTSIGVIARKSWQMIGADGIFLSHRGVFRLSQVDQNRLQTSPTPVAATQGGQGTVTDPIAPLLRRINWDYVHLAVSGQIGPYYALAVPIDGAVAPNAIAWLNTQSDKWEGIDTYDPRGQMQIDNLLAFDYLGEQRLFAVNHRTNTIHLLNEGRCDELAGLRYEIDMDVETRGYHERGYSATGFAKLYYQTDIKHDFTRVVIPAATWRPVIAVEEITQGANDRRLLTAKPITRDRRQYETFGKKPYDVTNTNDDALVPGRQDYSVELEGADVLHLGSGVNPDQKQESVLGGPGGFSTKCRGRFVRYRIHCTQGECDIFGVLGESNGSQREVRAAAA